MPLRPIAPPDSGNATAYSSSGIVQPFTYPSIVTSDASGNATFSWPTIPLGQIWIGSFSCPSAPYTAQFTAYNNQNEQFSWQSSNNPGSLRAVTNMTIEVEATGLVPKTLYTMNWVGYATTSGHAPQVVPESHTDVVIATNQGGLQGSFVKITGFANVLPGPQTGFAYRIHSVTTLNSGFAATADGSVELTDTGTTPSSTVFFAKAWETGQQVEDTNYFNGLLCSGEINGSIGPGMAQVYVHIRYDIIQI
jgi:hypothetical protein